MDSVTRQQRDAARALKRQAAEEKRAQTFVPGEAFGTAGTVFAFLGLLVPGAAVIGILLGVATIEKTGGRRGHGVVWFAVVAMIINLLLLLSNKR
jgi:hypothetical protein